MSDCHYLGLMAKEGLCYYLRTYEDKQIRKLDLNSEYVDLAAEVLALISDVTRIKIILALNAHTELSVNALAKEVGKRPAGVSQHLAKLRMARMVTTRQQGTTVYYQLVDEHAFSLVMEAVKQAEHAVSRGLTPPHHHSNGDGHEDGDGRG